MLDYASFLQKKSVTAPECGFESHEVNPKLFHWQTDIVHWALRKGKAAVFADCGLGKSCVQLQWAKEVSEHERKPVLVLTPLAVAQQTRREGIKFGIHVTVCRTQEDVQPGINVTNYEMIDHFDVNRFCGVVLDESSCIKHKDSKTRNKLQEMAHGKSDEFPSPLIKNWEDRLNQLKMLVTYFFTERKIGARMVPGEGV